MVVLDLDQINLACIETLRTAAAKTIAAPGTPWQKALQLRAISKALDQFKFVLQFSPSKAAEAYRETGAAVGALLLQVETALVVPVKYEKVTHTRQQGTVFGGISVKTLSR